MFNIMLQAFFYKPFGEFLLGKRGFISMVVAMSIRFAVMLALTLILIASVAYNPEYAS